MRPAQTVAEGVNQVVFGAPAHHGNCAAADVVDAPCSCGAGDVSPMAIVPQPWGMICRWELDDADRARIAAGGSVYLSILNGPTGPLYPVALDTASPFEGA